MKYLIIASLCASAFGLTQVSYAVTDATTLVIQGRSIPENSLILQNELTAVVGKSFILDGSKSQDDGVVRTFTWVQVGGPTVKLADATALKLSVTPPSAGTYVFELRVTDSTGLTSVAERTSVTVAASSITGDPDFDLLRVSLPTPTNPVYVETANTGINLMYEDKGIQVQTTAEGSKVNIAVGDVDGDGQAGPALLKIDTTRGGSSQGKVEVGWKVEEGTKLQGVEPDEIDYRDQDDDGDAVLTKNEEIETAIEVNKVTVRGWDPKKKEEFMAEQKSFAEVRSQQELENFAAGVLLKDEAIEEVQFNPKEISVSYQAEGKLLWLFPMNYTERMVVSEDEGTLLFKAKKPWYGFLISSKDDPDQTAEAVKVKHKETINMDAISWGVSSHASLLYSISNVLKTKHDTAKNSVSNVR